MKHSVEGLPLPPVIRQVPFNATTRSNRQSEREDHAAPTRRTCQIDPVGHDAMTQHEPIPFSLLANGSSKGRALPLPALAPRQQSPAPSHPDVKTFAANPDMTPSRECPTRGTRCTSRAPWLTLRVHGCRGAANSSSEENNERRAMSRFDPPATRKGRRESTSFVPTSSSHITTE